MRKLRLAATIFMGMLVLSACGGRGENQEPSRLETAKAVAKQAAAVAEMARQQMSSKDQAAAEEAIANLPKCRPVDGIGGDCPKGPARLVCINELLMADASPEIRENMRDTFLELYKTLPEAQRRQMMEQGEKNLAQAGKGCVLN